MRGRVSAARVRAVSCSEVGWGRLRSLQHHVACLAPAPSPRSALLTACVVFAAVLLPPAGSKDPKSLAGLVKALSLSQERVNADLMTYKGVLSKLEAAKEIMKASGSKKWRTRVAMGPWCPWPAKWRAVQASGPRFMKALPLEEPQEWQAVPPSAVRSVRCTRACSWPVPARLAALPIWLPIPLPSPQEFLAREKQKRAEREAEKARKAAEREAAAAQAQVPAEGSSA